ncbi:unnamed protein product, partial [Ectocarpus sp. 12 AP-2014]
RERGEGGYISGRYQAERDPTTTGVNAMGPKKSDKKATKGVDGEVQGEDPGLFLQNYQRFSRLIGISANPKVVAQLQSDENQPLAQACIVVDDEHGPLGPGGTRALMTAIMGTGQDMRGGPYRLIKSLRLWRAHCGDEGVRSIAEVLRLGGAEVKLEYVELFDDNIGPTGATALGQSLSIGCNKSLLSLKLDYNPSLGSEGTAALCRGLRTNSSLKQLHLPYCDLGSDAGPPLGEMLSYTKLQLAVLNLQGNRLEAEGTKALSPGLARNRSLVYLSLADNGIGSGDADVDALEDFRDAMMSCSTLTHVDLLYNRIGERGARVMLPALEQNRIKHFLVDATLPTPLFEA